MMPTILSITPNSGTAGELVRIVAAGINGPAEVQFGGVAATIVSQRVDGANTVIDLRTPPHEPGAVEVVCIASGLRSAPVAFRYLRAPLAVEADLTRVVRQLLRELKAQVLLNVSATASVDYDDTTIDGLHVTALAKVPSLVLSGPTVKPNRFYAANELGESVVTGTTGPEIVRHRPPYTVDLGFSITGTSERTAELFNLMAAVATFLNRNRWLEVLRDPSDPTRGTVRWELDADGEFRTQLAGRDDVRAFTCGLVVRGFDLDEGRPFDLARAVASPQLHTERIGGSA